MNATFLVDKKAIEFIKDHMKKENAPAVRVFIAGGGCCKRTEIAAVKKALAGDVSYDVDGIKIFVEKGLAENSSVIDIKFEEQKGLRIEFQS
jgi:Fe-S cluster assembly iron-binding protein IscA